MMLVTGTCVEESDEKEDGGSITAVAGVDPRSGQSVGLSAQLK